MHQYNLCMHVYLYLYLSISVYIYRSTPPSVSLSSSESPSSSVNIIYECIHGNRRNRRGHGALCAIQHRGVLGEPGGSGREECVKGAINNRAPHRRPRSRHRRAQRALPTRSEEGVIALEKECLLANQNNLTMRMIISAVVRNVELRLPLKHLTETG